MRPPRSAKPFLTSLFMWRFCRTWATSSRTCQRRGADQLMEYMLCVGSFPISCNT
ncbi:hypothetical protein KC19_2G162900 [Ceratodon purpureus]|uniref:Uncharacterized protein n=1 Tax=Ceratodon purpureus TaxID=3225 RepID=A0A8T0IXF2_CERPU|nr:hypothetical protein KC19_2G162900 [Ceratodon purpureus]